MTMKIIKLIMVMALATVPVISAFMEPANAQREDEERSRGRRYSQSNNVPDLRFSLVSQTSSGKSINDIDGDPTNDSGFFLGAIEDFFYLGNAGLEPTGLSPLSFNFSRGYLITRLNGDVVRYTIVSPQVFQFTDSNSNTTTDIGPAFVLTFELNVAGLSEDVKARYVNDLQFIVNNDVYVSALDSRRFVRNTFGFDLALPRGLSNSLQVSNIPNTIIPGSSNPNTTIPGSSNIVSP